MIFLSCLGEWKKGLFEGNGLFIHFTGIVIKGNFLQGKLDGYAEIYYCKEPKIYTLWKKGTIYENNLLTNKLNKSPSKNFNGLISILFKIYYYNFIKNRVFLRNKEYF